MAGARVYNGTNTCITFLTSGFEVELEFTEFGHDGVEVPTIDVSHMKVSAAGVNKIGNKPFLFGKIHDAGEYTFTAHFNPNIVPPLGVEEDVVVDFPLIGADSTNAQQKFKAALIGISEAIPLDDKMVADYTLKINGEIEYVAAT